MVVRPAFWRLSNLKTKANKQVIITWHTKDQQITRDPNPVLCERALLTTAKQGASLGWGLRPPQQSDECRSIWESDFFEGQCAASSRTKYQVFWGERFIGVKRYNENVGLYLWDYILTPSTLLFLWGQTAEKPLTSINKIWQIFLMQVTKHFFIKTPKVWFCSRDLWFGQSLSHNAICTYTVSSLCNK